MLPIIYGPQHQRVPPQRFAISYDSMPVWLRRVLAVRPDTAVVLVGDGMLDIRFGRCRVCTPLTNLAEVTTGRPRPGRSTIGVTFSPDGHGLFVGTGRATNSSGTAEQLVRVQFRRPVSATGPAAVVLRTRRVAIAAAVPDDLAASLTGAPRVGEAGARQVQRAPRPPPSASVHSQPGSLTDTVGPIKTLSSSTVPRAGRPYAWRLHLDSRQGGTVRP